MKITYRKKFLKQFHKLQRHQQLAVNGTIAAFKKNPHDAALQNHALKGSMKS